MVARDGTRSVAGTRRPMDEVVSGPTTTSGGFDALLPPSMARRAEDVGVAKAALPAAPTFTLAVLAGAFIGFGAMLSTVATTGAEDVIGYGPSRVLGGLVFSLGLVLVVVGGAELFTGNNLLVMALVARRIRVRAVLRNWAIVYAGNLAGALGTAWLVFASGQLYNGSGSVGTQALATAQGKSSLSFDDALLRGVLANVLVCLAVWLCFSARSVADKVLAIVFPITAFVAAGFEHSVANMYFLPVGVFVRERAPDSFWASTNVTPDTYADVTWGGFLANLVPVTAGNVIGGALLVGLVYAFVYSGSGARDSPRASDVLP
jgi:formate transporter